MSDALKQKQAAVSRMTAVLKQMYSHVLVIARTWGCVSVDEDGWVNRPDAHEDDRNFLIALNRFARAQANSPARFTRDENVFYGLIVGVLGGVLFPRAIERMGEDERNELAQFMRNYAPSHERTSAICHAVRDGVARHVVPMMRNRRPAIDQYGVLLCEPPLAQHSTPAVRQAALFADLAVRDLAFSYHMVHGMGDDAQAFVRLFSCLQRELRMEWDAEGVPKPPWRISECVLAVFVQKEFGWAGERTPPRGIPHDVLRDVAFSCYARGVMGEVLTSPAIEQWFCAHVAQCTLRAENVMPKRVASAVLQWAPALIDRSSGTRQDPLLADALLDDEGGLAGQRTG